MSRAQDLSGSRFGLLTAIRRSESRHGATYWECRCECGATVVVAKKSLRVGHTKSCGCYRRQFTTMRNRETSKHRMSATAEYRIWRNLRQRCENPSDKDFNRYGGRGITVAPEWSSFEQFFADMGPRPSPAHSIDRINNDGHYSASNCKWATPNEQQNNTRRNLLIEHGGVIKTATEWARELGINRSQFYDFKRRGKSFDQLFRGSAP